jgi:hypothetical protein
MWLESLKILIGVSFFPPPLLKTTAPLEERFANAPFEEHCV